jgi:hypothetical protein
VFGVYAPSTGGRSRGEPAMARPAIDLAIVALAYQQADFLFQPAASKVDSIAAISGPSPSSSRRHGRVRPETAAARRPFGVTAADEFLKVPK